MKYRRPDRPKRVKTWGARDSLHGEGKTKEILGSERRPSHGTGAGQGALSDSAPNWRDTALQYLTNAKKVKPKK